MTEELLPPQALPDAISAHFAAISDMSKAKALEGALQQTQKYVGRARGSGRRQAVKRRSTW
jgi:hypothetical protein